MKMWEGRGTATPGRMEDGVNRYLEAWLRVGERPVLLPGVSWRVVSRDEAENRSIWAARRHWKILSKNGYIKVNVLGGFSSPMRD